MVLNLPMIQVPKVELVTSPPSVSHIVDLDLFKLAIVLQKAKQIQDFGPTIVVLNLFNTIKPFTRLARSELGSTLPDWKNKDWSIVVTTDEILEYVIAKYGRKWKEIDEIVDIILKDL
ncbi:hypothetical protein Tco_1039712 [Tanacetum coccineum]